VALGNGVVPVLNAQVPPEAAMVGIRDVTGSEQARVRGAKEFVDDDTVVDLQPRQVGERGVGRHPDADHHQVGLHVSSIGELDDSPASVGIVRGDPRVGAQIHAV
jgi:hypothetical protein